MEQPKHSQVPALPSTQPSLGTPFDRDQQSIPPGGISVLPGVSNPPPRDGESTTPKTPFRITGG